MNSSHLQKFGMQLVKVKNLKNNRLEGTLPNEDKNLAPVLKKLMKDKYIHDLAATGVIVV